MSSALAIDMAVAALVAAALPDAETRAPEGSGAKPLRGDGRMLAIVLGGDNGTPEVDLSPLTYNYDRRIGIALTTPAGASLTGTALLDAALLAIGDAILADRTLGGRCLWIDAERPVIEDVTAEGSAVLAGCDLIVTASYATHNPLD